MRVLRFLIQTHILISLAAVTLTQATAVQVGMPPEAHAYLAVIFFATMLDYNFHRFMAVNLHPEALKTEKFKWAAQHLLLLRILIITSFSGLLIALYFVSSEIMYFLAFLGILTILYSISLRRNPKSKFSIPGITGMKTILLAFVWTEATVFLPLLQSGKAFELNQILLIFCERFIFIFAIAIPFDIRDKAADTLSGIRTIPTEFGTKRALQISNTAMAGTLFISIIHYWYVHMTFIILALLISMACVFVAINSKKLKNKTFYYHGILDGCILIYGLLIWLCFYLQC